MNFYSFLRSLILLACLTGFSGYVFADDLSSVRQSSSGDQDQFLPVCVSFYNLENLFDTIDDPDRNDTEFTPEGSNKWNAVKYEEKLENLAEVISQIGTSVTPDGPAILGVSEIENEIVLQDLANEEKIKDRNYQHVYYRGRDRRVDNALLYNPKYFEVTASSSVPTKIEDFPGFRTRDHLVVSGLLLGEPFHFIVAHWPSRRGGEKESRPNRIAAAKAARSIIDSLKNMNQDAKIVFMGDLNDDPDDESVSDYLNTAGDKKDLKYDQLYNPFYKMAEKGQGTLAYRDAWNLFDQIIISQSLLGNDQSHFKYHTASIFKKPFMLQTSGRFQGYPYRSYGGGVYLGGYSDHFPAYIVFIRKIK